MMDEANPQSTPSISRRFTAFETTLLAGGVVLFLVLLFDMLVLEEFLSPPLIGIAAIIMLWPLRHSQAARALLLSGGFLMVLWFLDEISTILIPFVLVYLLAYLFDPVVTTLKARFDVPRGVSSLVVTGLLVGIVALFVFLVVPSIVAQLEVLAQRVVEGVTFLRRWVAETTLLDGLEEFGVDKEQLVQQLSIYMQEQATALATSIPNAVQELASSIGSLLAVITVVTIVPVLLYYTLKDYPHIKARLVELFPTWGGRRDYLVKAGGIVGNYVRGQLTISAIAAFNVSVVLLLFDVPFALLIGLVGGILNIIPSLGIIVTDVIGVTIGFIFGDPWYFDVLIILGVLMAQSLLEQTVLTPKILSYEVGLHPVLIVLSLFVFGYLLGIFGLLIAVPATALIMTVYKSYRREWSLDLSANAPAAASPPGAPVRRQPPVPSDGPAAQEAPPEADGAEAPRAPEATDG